MIKMGALWEVKVHSRKMILWHNLPIKTETALYPLSIETEKHSHYLQYTLGTKLSLFLIILEKTLLQPPSQSFPELHGVIVTCLESFPEYACSAESHLVAFPWCSMPTSLIALSCSVSKLGNYWRRRVMSHWHRIFSALHGIMSNNGNSIYTLADRGRK